MQLHKGLFLSILLPISLLAADASANGFILNDHGAKATGRMDAVVATVDDGSAIFYNPAGIARRDGVNLYLGAAFIQPTSGFTEESTGVKTDSETDLAITPNFYVHGAIGDIVRAGIGVNTPVGIKLGWPMSSPGADVSRFSSLRTVYITPTVGADLSKFVPGLYFAAGFDIVPSSVELKQDLFFGDQTGSVHLGGDGMGFGGRAGIQYHPAMVPGLSLGLAYRSEVSIDYEGDGDFDAPAPFRSSLPPDGAISTNITMPQSVLGGVAYRPIPGLEVEFNFTWIGWSSFDTIDIETDSGATIVSDRGFKDTITYRLGVEYSLANLGLDVRAGYGYDPTPIPDSKLTVSLPDIDRHVVSVGGSYRISPMFYVDAGFLYVLPGDNTTGTAPNEPQLKGTYDVEALVFALSLGAQFGGSSAAQDGPLVTAQK